MKCHLKTIDNDGRVSGERSWLNLRRQNHRPKLECGAEEGDTPEYRLSRCLKACYIGKFVHLLVD